MDSYVSFIEQYGNMIGAHMASVKDFLSNNHIRSIGWEYNEAKNSQPENPFNVFTMASLRGCCSHGGHTIPESHSVFHPNKPGVHLLPFRDIP